MKIKYVIRKALAQLGLFDTPVMVHPHRRVTHSGKTVEVQQYPSHRKKKPDEEEPDKPTPLLSWREPDQPQPPPDKPTGDDIAAMLAKLEGQADPALLEKLRAVVSEYGSKAKPESQPVAAPAVGDPQEPPTPTKAVVSGKVTVADRQDTPHDPERVKGLIELFRERLKSGTLPSDPKALREVAQQHAGGGNAGDYIDDVYDSLEGALARHHAEQSPNASRDSVKERLERADRHESMLARRSRSLGLSALQQFSTPLPIAEAAQIAASPRPGDTVLEPTAGTANLISTIAAHHEGPIVANELSDRRANVLRNSEWPKNVEIEQGDYLWRKGKADVVVANPPWGKYSTGRYGSAMKVGGFMPGDVAERFVVKMMGDLNDGGRAVVVMPTTMMGSSGASFRQWLQKNHTVRAMIELPDQWYSRRGTNVASVLLVVDKGKTADAPAPIVHTMARDASGRNQTGSLSLDDLAGLLHPLTAGGTHQRLPVARSEVPNAKETDRQVARDSVSPEREEPPAGGARGDVREVESGRTRPTRRQQPGSHGVRPKPAGLDTNVVARQPGPKEPERAADTKRTEPVVAGVPSGDDALRAKHAKAAKNSPVFAEFTRAYPYARNPDRRHPRLVVESRNLAAVPYPELTYKVDQSLLDANENGRISNESLVAIAAARQANTNGHAMLLADATGLGKSRIGGGWVLDLLKQKNADGTPKHRKILVVTKSYPNIEDLQDEFRTVASGQSDTELGGHFPARFVNISQYKDATNARADENEQQWTPLPEPSEDEQAVYFLEASTGPSRFQKAIDRLNPDAAMLDESHEFKNIDDTEKGHWWSGLHSTLMAKGSPMFYMTATPATSVDELQYLYGLGEWSLDGFGRWVRRVTGQSDESAMGRSKDLAEGEQEGGVTGEKSIVEAKAKKSKFKDGKADAFAARFTPAEQEQIMRELKMKGKFMARDLWRDFDFEANEKPLAPEEAEEFNKVADLLKDIRVAHQEFRGQNKVDKKICDPTSNLQFATKRILAHYRLKRAVQLAKESLDRGEQPVIALEYINETKPDEGNVLAAIQTINTWHREAATDDDGHVIPGEAAFEEKIPEAVERQMELIDRARHVIPNLEDPIEYVRRELGPKNVIAITGKTDKNERSALRTRFQNGEAKCAVISQAGQTGISLHDVNKARRHMIMADYPWSAPKAMQCFGRVDRTGQKSPARITALHQGSAPEKKFIATIAARIKSLGATSKGQAESTRTDALDDFEFNTPLDRMGLREAWRDMPDEDRHHFMHRSFRDKNAPDKPAEEITGDVKRFLLELQWMPLDASERAFQKFIEHREKVFDREGADYAARTQATKAKVLRTTNLREGDIVPLQLHEYEYQETNPKAWVKAADLPIEVRAHLPNWSEETGVWHRDDVHELTNAAMAYERGIDQQLQEKRYDKPEPIKIRKALLTGMITPEMVKIRHYLEKSSGSGLPRRVYRRLKEDGTGKDIVGLELPAKSITGVRDLYGKLTKRKPEDVMPDLKIWQKVPISHGGWHLEMGKAGTREGRIVIHGPKKADADVLTRWGAQHSAVGDYFWMPEEKVDAFVREFGLPDKQTAMDTANTARTAVASGETFTLPNKWTVEPNPANRNFVRVRGPRHYDHTLQEMGGRYDFRQYIWYLPAENVSKFVEQVGGEENVEKCIRIGSVELPLIKSNGSVRGYARSSSSGSTVQVSPYTRRSHPASDIGEIHRRLQTIRNSGHNVDFDHHDEDSGHNYEVEAAIDPGDNVADVLAWHKKTGAMLRRTAENKSVFSAMADRARELRDERAEGFRGWKEDHNLRRSVRVLLNKRTGLVKAISIPKCPHCGNSTADELCKECG